MKGKRILFEIAHPKHFHQFKPMMEALRTHNEVHLIARDKDVVLDLVRASNLPFEHYGRHGKGLIQKLLFIPRILFDYWKVVKRFKPDLIVSRSSPYSPIISKFSKAKTVVFPDAEVVPLINNFVAPNADLIVTPDNFKLQYGDHHHRVNGFFEEAYLSTDAFLPDPSKLKPLGLGQGETFSLLRFVGWFANHDVNQGGFTTEQKKELVERLLKKGRVFISSEAELPEWFSPYQLKVDPNHIHHVLHYASLYIGDSQTMATEAALLGTPAIRFNSFVGKNDMSNFIILEKELDMLRNVGSFEDLIKVLDVFLDTHDLKSQWLVKRKDFFANKPDLTEQSLEKLELALT